MKKMTFLLAFLLSLGFSVDGVTQSTLPSDTTTLPYVVDDIVSAIQDCYEQPVVTNEYAHFLSNESGFPPLPFGETLTAGHLEQLSDWVRTHPASVEKFLIRRKKNYDLYFNPALQE